MAPSPQIRFIVVIAVPMLALLSALVSGNQTNNGIANGLYAVTTSGNSGQLRKVGSVGRRTIVAVTNLDTRETRTLTLRRIDSATSGATLTRLRWNRADQCQANRPNVKLSDTGPGSEPPTSREFVVYSGTGSFNDARFFHSVTARRVGFNDAVSVFSHPAAEMPTDSSIERLLRVFDCQHSAVARLFGRYATDIDTDSRFAVLLVPRPKPGLPTAYVRPIDFDTSAPAGLSNCADLMYLSVDLPADPRLETLIAHEYAHAVYCSLKPGIMEEDWLHEGIAHLVEHLCAESQANVDHRLSRYFENTHDYPLLVTDYFAAGLYREHGCRGATATFLRSVQRRCDKPDELLTAMVTGNTTGVQNLEQATGTRFSALIRDWTADQLLRISHPKTVGQFLSLGPRTVPCHQHVEVSIKPTATAFVELAGDVGDYQFHIDGHVAPQVTLCVLDKMVPLGIKTLRSAEALDIVCKLPAGKRVVRFVCSAETVFANRSVSLGLHEGTQNEPVVFRLSPDDGPITVKAFAEFADGSVATCRSNVQPGLLRLTSREESRR